MTRALVVCPGRGSYDRAALGQLQDRSAAATAVIDACDAWRAAHDRPTVRALDAAESFRGNQHVAGEHASLLTFACSLADLADLADRFEVVGVIGNSMGFYTALAASGALPLDDAIRLVDTMGWYQKGNVVGGQILYPVSGPDWDPDPVLLDAVDHALATAPGFAAWSIRLGGFAVLGGDRDGLAHLMATLPPVELGSRKFPVQLPLHSAFHTALMRDTSERALAELADLRFRPPRVPLIDGRGAVHAPWWADPAALCAYTLGHQVVEAFDFDAALTTALHHCGPDVVVLLGPGNSLGGPCARLLTRDGWRGARTREALDAVQRDEPILLSFGVSQQRKALV